MHDVALAYVRPDQVDGAFFDCVAALLLHDGQHDQRVQATIGAASGPRISRARCDVVKAFLAGPAEWLWMLDCDMTFAPDTLDRMLAIADKDKAPILGALAFAGGRSGLIVPTIFVAHRNEAGELRTENVLRYPVNELIQVDATGAACLLVHRSTLEAIELRYREHTPLPWFQESVIDGQEFGEDITFCLRAGSVGAPVHIHTGIQVGHRKTHVLDEARFKEFAALVDAGVSERQITDAEVRRNMGGAP